MKKSIFLFALLFLAFSVEFVYSQDTLWTRRYDIPGFIKNAIFSPDDSKILVTGTETFFEVNPENGEMIRELPEFKTGIIAINPKTNIGINYLCQLVDLNTYQVIKNIIDTSKFSISMYDFTFNSELNKVAFINNAYPIGGNEHHQNFVIIDLETGKETIIEKEFGDNEGSGAKISMSADGKYLSVLTGYFGQNQDPTDDYRLLSLFDLETNKKVKKLEFPLDLSTWSMKFSPDGSMLAVNDGYINIYSVPNLEYIDKFQFIPQTGGITNYVFTKDSKNLLICGGIRPMQKFAIKDKFLLSDFIFRYSLELLALQNQNNNRILVGSGGGLMLYPDLQTGIIPKTTEEITIKPNPVTGQLILQLSTLQVDNCKILILDNSGKNIFTQECKFINEDISINVSHYPKGIYFVNIENNNKILQTLKFIKE